MTREEMLDVLERECECSKRVENGTCIFKTSTASCEDCDTYVENAELSQALDMALEQLKSE